MKIDRQRALQAFQEYAGRYDLSRDMIRLKAEHTYRVSGLCQQIAASLGLGSEDVDLAWLTGLLHDVGRFEQQKRYGTFNDAQSIDHAKYGAELLFGAEHTDIGIRDFVESDEEDQLIRTAVYHHSAYRIPEDLDERTAMFCNILRDADKVDIFRVNVEFPLEEIYNVPTEVLYRETVTPEVLANFDEQHAVLRSLKKTAVDHVVGHLSLVYELVYPESRRIAREQGYLEQLMSFQSENPETCRQFEHIREKMRAFLSDI